MVPLDLGGVVSPKEHFPSFLLDPRPVLLPPLLWLALRALRKRAAGAGRLQAGPAQGPASALRVCSVCAAERTMPSVCAYAREKLENMLQVPITVPGTRGISRTSRHSGVWALSSVGPCFQTVPLYESPPVPGNRRLACHTCPVTRAQWRGRLQGAAEGHLSGNGNKGKAV